MTNVDRSLIASIAANTQWSRRTSREARRQATAPGREGLRRKWAAEVDPDGTLPPNELAAAIERRQAAHMARMSLAAAQARRARNT